MTPSLVSSYPFPFLRDDYRYSANVEPSGVTRNTDAGAWGDKQVVIDHSYRRELSMRADILSRDPSRYQCLPHMTVAAWDAMLTIMRTLATDHPENMTLERDGARWTWTNSLLGVEQIFEMGNAATLPEPPLKYACSQIQEDVVLLDQRDGQLFGDAGVVTFAADWSLGFDAGMSFRAIHGPVPRLHADNIVTRAQDFLMRLEPGQSYRRTNWTLTVDGILDTSVETYPDWGEKRKVLGEGPIRDVGARLFLRTEVQHLVRLAHSGAVMFLIRTCLLPFDDVASVPGWATRLHDVLVELPSDMADYKGLTRTRGPAIEWLRTFGGA